MDRRDFLRLTGAAGGCLLLSGCTASSGRPAAPRATAVAAPSGGATPPGAARTGVTRSGWRALARELAGEVLRPGDDGFAAAHQLYNPRFDAVRPTAVVRAASTDDVAETIRFARRHQIALRARSGGHSYVGASTVAGGIVLDLRALDRVQVHPSQGLVDAQAGARLFDLHTALEPHGLTVPTGTCPTVGVAGLTLGGGIGVESRSLGLTCDRLRGLTLVDAAGIVHRVGAHRRRDLWWAARGGGGRCGVVTAMTFASAPAHPMSFFFLYYTEPDAAAVIGGWQHRLRSLPRSAWANVHLDARRDGGLDVRIVGLSFDGDAAGEAEAMVAAVGREPARTSLFTRSHADGVRLLAGCAALSDAECAPRPDGVLGREAFAAGSDVVGDRLPAGTVDALVGHVRRWARSGREASLLLDPLGGRVGDVPPSASAFRWRRASAVAQWYVPLKAADRPGLEAATQRAHHWIRAGHRAFRAASVGGYVNYAEPGRGGRGYFGGNLGRLQRVAARADPDGFFRGRG